MSKIEDIERAVSNLAPEDYARFRAWFEDFEAARFDQRIEADAADGKLDGFAEDALADLRKGRTREL
jgi:hypothetical protein